MPKWSCLDDGDVIDVVAPGFPSTKKDITNSKKVIEAEGLKVRLPEKMQGRDVLCANTDERRGQLLLQAIHAKDSKVIWSVRGGYGSLRLIEMLQRHKPKSPKLLIGFSDITVLQSFILEQWGWVSLHGPNFERLGKGPIQPRYLRELFDIVRGKKAEMKINGLHPLNSVARKSKTVRGTLKGGNLITLQGLIGTPAEMNPQGSILFFEDIGERGYRVDRVLKQMMILKYFKKCRAVIFGDFTGGHEPDGRDKNPSVLKRFAEEVNIPVFSGFPCGHSPVQRPLAFGMPAELGCGSSGSISYSFR